MSRHLEYDLSYGRLKKFLIDYRYSLRMMSKQFAIPKSTLFRVLKRKGFWFDIKKQTWKEPLPCPKKV